MKKNIEDYLYLYPFCDIVITSPTKVIYTNEEQETLYYQPGEYVKSPHPYIVLFELPKDAFKLVLRKIDSLTKEEKNWLLKNHGGFESYNLLPVIPTGRHCNLWMNDRDPEVVRYLLTRKFDIFRLIPDGLAEDVANYKQQSK